MENAPSQARSFFLYPRPCPMLVSTLLLTRGCSYKFHHPDYAKETLGAPGIICVHVQMMVMEIILHLLGLEDVLQLG